MSVYPFGFYFSGRIQTRLLIDQISLSSLINYLHNPHAKFFFFSVNLTDMGITTQRVFRIPCMLHNTSVIIKIISKMGNGVFQKRLNLLCFLFRNMMVPQTVFSAYLNVYGARICADDR